MTQDRMAMPTPELLGLAMSESATRDHVYEAQQALFARWRQGRDVELLAALLRSEKSRDRSFGVYFLDESSPPSTSEILEAVHALATDPIPECRRAFVKYVTFKKICDDVTVTRLAECLYDLEIRVRTAAIDWAANAEDETFATFSRLIDQGVGSSQVRRTTSARVRSRLDLLAGYNGKRGARGLEIARRLRAGQSVDEIRNGVAEEDSLVFDLLAFRASRRR